MARKPRARRLAITEVLARRHPDLLAAEGGDAAALVATGRVQVGGRPVLSAAAMVPEDAAITVRPVGGLRGSPKLAAALDRFAVTVAGRTALDAGAAAGGFTTVLLERGARIVYAVDVGHGQLRGSLRQDPRVVDLERTNLADLDVALVPDPVDLVTLDLSYLSLTAAVPQLDRVALAAGAELVALVKPMFELALPTPPEDPRELRRGLAVARDGVERAGWTVQGDMASPVQGARGAEEFLLHAVRRRPQGPVSAS